MNWMRIYPFYKGKNIAKDPEGYDSAFAAVRHMDDDELIKDFEKTLPEDFEYNQLYVYQADEKDTKKGSGKLLISHYTEVDSDTQDTGSSSGIFDIFSGKYCKPGKMYVKTEEDSKKDVFVHFRYEDFEKRVVFLKNVKNKHLKELLDELVQIEKTDVSELPPEGQQHCIAVYEEIDALGYHPVIQESIDEYRRLLNKYIRENVEFRKIHKDYYEVIPLEKKPKPEYQKSNELF